MHVDGAKMPAEAVTTEPGEDLLQRQAIRRFAKNPPSVRPVSAVCRCSVDTMHKCVL